MKVPVAVLISGRGSNLAALLAAARDPAFPATVVLVIANCADAPGLCLATAAGVSAIVIDHRNRTREQHEIEIADAVETAGARIVCLAGYLRRLTPFLVGRFVGRMLNVHPSLLPAFPGLHTHARAMAAGVKLHGCTIHLVTDAVDDGPILAQAAVPVLPNDTEESLAARVLAAEHMLYPATLAWFAAGHPSRQADGNLILANPLPDPPAVA